MRILTMVAVIIGCQGGDIDSEVKLDDFVIETDHLMFEGAVKVKAKNGNELTLALKIEYQEETQELLILTSRKKGNEYVCFTKFSQKNYPFKYGEENRAEEFIPINTDKDYEIGASFIAPSEEEIDNQSWDSKTNLQAFSILIPYKSGRRKVLYNYFHKRDKKGIIEDSSATKALSDIKLCIEGSPSGDETPTAQ